MSLTAICMFVGTMGFGVQPPASTDDCSIQLVDVPAQVVIPTAQGWNLFFTARVNCPDVRSVWIARDETSLTRLMMMNQGDSTYQINLGAPEVQATLRTNDRNSTFTVFADTTGGRMVRSLPVSYTVAAYEVARFKLFVVTTKDRFEYVYYSHRWFQPDDVQQLELEIEHAPAGSYQVRMEADRQSTTCQQDPTAGRITCQLTNEIKAAWKKTGRLKVGIDGLNRDNRVSYELLAVPQKLNLHEQSARFHLSQRSAADVPGSLGFVRVRIGDISGAQTSLSVETCQSDTLMHPTYVHKGSTVRFKYASVEYVLVVEELVNRLFEGDYLELSAMSATQWETKNIDRLLVIIENSTEKFLRDGVEYSGSDAAKHLRTKRSQFGKPIETLDEFIEKIASRSIISGKPYQIKLSDGSIMDAPTWYRKQLGLEAPAQPSQAAGNSTP